MFTQLISLLIPSALAFAIGLLLQPVVSKIAYKYKLWKHSKRIEGNDAEISENFKKIYAQNDLASEVSTPRVGGIVIWASVVLTALALILLQTFKPSPLTFALDFTSRNQTLIPFVVLVVMSLVGLFDDLVNVFKSQGKLAHGISGKYFAGIAGLLGLFGGFWFYTKLGVTAISIPLVGVVSVGWLIIPIFTIVALGVFSSGVIDGIDGLAGGVMAIIFGAYGTIALVQGQVDLAALCFSITGGTLAFLWFNVPPAKFYLGETGMLGLTSTLTFIAFLTDKAIWLPIIAFPLFATALSSALQMASKKIRGPEKGKIFLVAPLHHHFEAQGWSRAAIVMRYWVVTFIFGCLGVLLVVATL